MANQKQHSGEAGYIAERANPYVVARNGRTAKVVIYDAAQQGIDTAGQRHAVVCDAHGQIGGAPSLPEARKMMKRPDEFCTECRALAGE